ncbi:nociceptin receptor-like [Patiria miniata]|uniref:G-protein coupled receptors family 1 profile domain-containing protein n=1 Tax=Patiria miniata TaxID=46514 RepID=A0A914BBZ5_PATMI|nr:nociceptin receptor-like [Patiria miniata]
MWSYNANVTVYAQATMSLAQLDILVCTFFTCVFQNNSDNCSVAYSLPQYDHLLIWDARGPAPGAPMNESYNAQSNETYKLFNHLLELLGLDNPAEADKYVYSNTETVLYGFALPVLKLLGILSILSFFFTLLRVPSMRNVTNFYLTNLGVADLIVLISGATYHQCAVLTTQNRLDIPYFGGSIQAVVSVLIYFANVGGFSSLAFVIVLSYDRYFAICHPLKYRNLNLKRRAIRAAVCIWLLSLSVNVLFLWTKFQSLNAPAIKCLVWPKEEKYKHLSGNVQMLSNNDETVVTCFQVIRYMVLCTYMLSLILTCTFNILLIKGLHAPNPTGDQIQGPSKHLGRVTLILGINTAVVFVCFLPQVVTALLLILSQSLDEVNLSADVKRALLLMTACLRVINSSINSVIFNAGSGRYRKAFKQAFCCGKRQQVHVPTINIPLQTLPRADPADRIRS